MPLDVVADVTGSRIPKPGGGTAAVSFAEIMNDISARLRETLEGVQQRQTKEANKRQNPRLQGRRQSPH